MRKAGLTIGSTTARRTTVRAGLLGSPHRHRLPVRLVWLVGIVALAVSVPALAAVVDTGALAIAWDSVWRSPRGLLVAVAAFATAFLVRAWLWQRMVPALGFGQAWAGIHVALAANHVLPLRLGEGARVVSVLRRTDVGVAPATASAVALRAADVVTVAAIAAVLAPAAVVGLLGWWGLAVLVGVGAVGGIAVVSLRRQGRRAGPAALGGLDPVVVAGAGAAWALEAVLVWQSAAWVGIELDPAGALLVTAVAVMAQVVAVAPAGIGTYEAASVAAYATLGVDPGVALAAAVVAHAVKTVYSLVVGGVALVAPGPGLAGRFRLPRTRSGSASAVPEGTAPEETAPADMAPERRAPVVLFLPARNEAPRVAGVVDRAPEEVAGHPVEVVVVDDGSTDATAEVAAAAGATVVAIGGLGLGAGVRRGLAEGVARGAAAVAFCDADGEYDPAELERLVGPILAGEADYVVGSRFSGAIEHMLPHRRLGNVVLTRMLAFAARTPVTDGQSGYRALSLPAASAAEVIHDFNYAQVLTLDLLAKGFRYAEVPISYRFRTSGRSFVRLGRYLRHVGPAVWRQLNVGHDGLGVATAAAGRRVGVR